MKEEKRIHKGYENSFGSKQMFGKYQYLYESEKGKISLIELKDYWNDGEDLWEIYCLEGNLFEDTERFSTKKEAVEEIKKLLTNKQ